MECPRDSWQGLHHTLPTEVKVAYLRTLIGSGFRWLDLASFVSPKWVPQMADSEAVLAQLPAPAPLGADYLAIVLNRRGLERALACPQVTSLGFPLSLSETFQVRNSAMDTAAAWAFLEELVVEVAAAGRRLVVYLSMGFGNPYGDPYQVSDLRPAVARGLDLGVRDWAVADTIGRASPQLVDQVAQSLSRWFEGLHFGLHLHARPEHTGALVTAAQRAGVRWIEGALGGVGGCPFAADALVGNLATEEVARYSDLGFAVSEQHLRELAALAKRLSTSGTL